MEMQMTLAECCENLADVAVIARIRRVRYNRIQVPSCNTIIVVARDKHTVGRLLKEKRRWIERKIAALRDMESLAAIKEGEFYYFGEPRRYADGVAALKKQARKDLLSHALVYLKQNSAMPPTVAIRRMRSRLGTYSAKKDEIRLSAYLVFLPHSLIDYIIFHEFAHRDIRNHGSGFWKKIETRYPDWKSREREIDLWWLRVKKQINKYKDLELI